MLRDYYYALLPYFDIADIRSFHICMLLMENSFLIDIKLMQKEKVHFFLSYAGLFSRIIFSFFMEHINLFTSFYPSKTSHMSSLRHNNYYLGSIIFISLSRFPLVWQIKLNKLFHFSTFWISVISAFL